jgi:spore germination protein GerM
VERRIGETRAVARAALAALLQGPTREETEAGYFSSINPGVELRNLELVEGVANVDFDGTISEGVAGSCLVSAIRAQITQTLLQFDTVDSVRITVEGSIESPLQP